jgi:CheY-like chemotaxis protein
MKRALICDDDAATRFLARRMLAELPGWTVEECSNGPEALEIIGHGGVDLLVLDLGMPMVDGVEVLAILRGSPTFGQMPVIILSRHSREDLVLRLLRLGVSGYITKPLTAKKLGIALERVALGSGLPQPVDHASEIVAR